MVYMPPCVYNHGGYASLWVCRGVYHGGYASLWVMRDVHNEARLIGRLWEVCVQ